MSEERTPDFGLSDDVLNDQTVQREWDRFAMPDHSVDPQSDEVARDKTVDDSHEKGVATNIDDPPLAPDPTTPPGDDSADPPSAPSPYEESDDGDARGVL